MCISSVIYKMTIHDTPDATLMNKKIQELVDRAISSTYDGKEFNFENSDKFLSECFEEYRILLSINNKLQKLRLMKFKNTRGYRNNNPGNLRHGSQWAGLSKKQTDTSFCQFDSMYMGLRALCKLLSNYIKNGNNTIEKIISRYAPANENNTKSYISSVCSLSGISSSRVLVYPNTETSVYDISKIVAGIVCVENGDKPNFKYWVYYSYICFFNSLI